MEKLLFLLLSLAFVACSSRPELGQRSIAQENQESSGSSTGPTIRLSPKSKAINGGALEVILTFPQGQETEDDALSGELVLKLIDGETKTILFPFFERDQGEFVAIVGIPYRTIPGNYDLKVLVTAAETQESTFAFAIKKGNYGKDSPLSVDPNTVKPDEQTQKLIEEQQKILDQIYASSEDQKLWSKFGVPVSKPVITSNYGNARTYNGSLMSYHSGMDYRANESTPLKSAGDGIVRLREHLHFTGNTVIIDHGKGLFTIYGHLSKFSKDLKEGQMVKKGEYIGQAGRTGRVTGPHLHFGLKIHGELVNPTFLYTLE